MKYIYWALIGFSVAFLGCTSDVETANNTMVESDLKAVLEGTWQTVQINVAVNTVDGLDSFHAVSLTERTWSEQQGVKPPVLYFQADQQYRRIIETSQGEILTKTNGTWRTNSDTLLLMEGDSTARFLVKEGKGKAALRTMLDWDGDGLEDDEYQAVYRQISIGTN